MATATALQHPRTTSVPEPLLATAVEDILPLENGDRLSRPEFERRYNAMPSVKAELIEGVVYMASPVSVEQHGRPHSHVMAWLGAYWYCTPGVNCADNSSIRFDFDNMPQPDAILYIETGYGGQLRVARDGIAESAPELILEVAASSVSYDLNAKLQVYRRQGVPEYVVWRTRDRAIDWFVLENGEYVRLALAADGLYRSRVFPGLWLNPKALVEDDRETMLRVSRDGAASEEHLAFVERLKLAGLPKATEG